MAGSYARKKKPELAWSFWAEKGYRPKRPEESPLFQVVQETLQTFLAEAELRADGTDGVPRFIEKEFRRFLECGCLAGGFARLKCEGCGHERLVPFSCKGRGVCPSCSGRRMAERAAHLVDEVIPAVPVRQWVMEKLAAIIPRPQKNLVIYHGVLGARAKLRKKVVAYKRLTKPEEPAVEPEEKQPEEEQTPDEAGNKDPRYYSWADLLRRMFDLDVLECPECGGRFKLIALIEEREAIEKILTHLDLPTEVPKPLPARAPPDPDQLDLL